MVLSCCDLLASVAISVGFALYAFIWLTENNDLYPRLQLYWHLASILCGNSLLTLLVMCIERYLGAYYPLFHRISVTRRRLLTSLAIMISLSSPLGIISANDMVISFPMASAIFIAIVLPPFMFFNYKLFKKSTQLHRTNVVSPKERMKKGLKNVSTCLFAVACYILYCIPISLYIVFSSVKGPFSDNTRLLYCWAAVAYLMNCTFNSLIFFWRNKILQVEGVKIMKIFKERIFGTKRSTVL